MNFSQASAVAQALRRANPRATIVLGGPHLTSQPELLLDHPEFDLGVAGEGEMTTQELIEAMEAGRAWEGIPGVVWARDGELHRAPPRTLIDDLDQLPLPARHLLPILRYRPMPNDQWELPKTSIITSRGCPFRCIFCDKAVFGQRYRSLSPARVVQEFHHLEQEFGVRDVAFVDSTFTPNRQRLASILDAMEKDPPRATWTCSCRADVLDEDLLRRMRALGCWRIRIAIESGDEDVLARICKDVTLDQFAHTVHLAASLDFQVKAFFMVGHIGETPETVERSIRFAESLPLTDVTVQINTPLRGTPQYHDCAQHGTMLEERPGRGSFFAPVFVPQGMTFELLLDAQRSFYRRFYLRPVALWRQARIVRRSTDVSKYVRAIPLATSVMFGR